PKLLPFWIYDGVRIYYRLCKEFRRVHSCHLRKLWTHSLFTFGYRRKFFASHLVAFVALRLAKNLPPLRRISFRQSEFPVRCHTMRTHLLVVNLFWLLLFRTRSKKSNRH